MIKIARTILTVQFRIYYIINNIIISNKRRTEFVQGEKYLLLPIING